jgi:hypothetical protein
LPRRSFSSSGTPAAAPKPSSSSNGNGGATLRQRVTSFAVGAGLTALFSQYYIYTEVRTGNAVLLQTHAQLARRVQRLEEAHAAKK